ncbi:MAG: YaiI/YqxD family protein [Planctomycetota bacterium]
MNAIYIDADGCPVKDEVYRVAQRHGLKVFVVANAWMKVPPGGMVEMVLAGSAFDAADNWIAEHAVADDVVVTADIPLAARCVEKGVRTLDSKGRVFTPESIGDTLATRNLLAGLRETGQVTGGPAPFAPRDRSQFLHKLDEIIRAACKARQDLS